MDGNTSAPLWALGTDTTLNKLVTSLILGLQKSINFLNSLCPSTASIPDGLYLPVVFLKGSPTLISNLEVEGTHNCFREHLPLTCHQVTATAHKVVLNL